MDPRYTDFGEVEFSALHPTIHWKYEISEELNLFKLDSMSKVLAAVWLGGGSFAAYWFKLITKNHLGCGGNSG